MSAMTYNGYAARIDYDADDEIFVGHLAGINDVVGFHADTVSDLKEAFHEAVDDYVATCAKAGKKPEKPFSGKLMLRVDPAIHARSMLVAELQGVSLNQWAETVLDEASRRAAPRMEKAA